MAIGSEEQFRRMFVGTLVSLCISRPDTIPYDLVDVTENEGRTDITLDLKFPYIYVRDDRSAGKVGRIKITVHTEGVRDE